MKEVGRCEISVLEVKGIFIFEVIEENSVMGMIGIIVGCDEVKECGGFGI